MKRGSGPPPHRYNMQDRGQRPYPVSNQTFGRKESYQAETRSGRVPWNSSEPVNTINSSFNEQGASSSVNSNCVQSHENNAENIYPSMSHINMSKMFPLQPTTMPPPPPFQQPFQLPHFGLSLQHPPPLYLPPPNLLPPPLPQLRPPLFSNTLTPPPPVAVPRFPPPPLPMPPQSPFEGHQMTVSQGQDAGSRVQFPTSLDIANKSGTDSIQTSLPLQHYRGKTLTSTPVGLRHTLDNDIKQVKKEEVGAQDEVNKWLENVHSKSSSSLNPLTQAPKQERQRKLKTIPIPEVHKKLHLVLHSLAAVQGAMQQLQEKLVTSDANEWQEAIAKTTQLKADYLNAKEQLNMSQMSELKLKLDARRKKRMRQKKRKEEAKEDEQQELYERAQKHLAIDQWRHHIQQKDLQQKQIKEMKLTADKTLGKVVREIREARKMLDTLAGLKKLRSIRSDAAELRGQLFPSSVGEHFNSKTDDLMELLTEQIVACEKEEASLKLIVQTEQAEAREKEENAQRQRQKEEEEQGLQEDLASLFGPEVVYFNNSPMVPFEQFYQQACLNLHSLLAIRETWDSFLVPEGTPGSSQVPDGCVEPDPPSSTTWATALKTS